MGKSFSYSEPMISNSRRVARQWTPQSTQGLSPRMLLMTPQHKTEGNQIGMKNPKDRIEPKSWKRIEEPHFNMLNTSTHLRQPI